jgi:hypothetical protein
VQRISGAEMASTSLGETHVWTGIHINCFVNIIKTRWTKARPCMGVAARAREATGLFEDSKGREDESRRQRVDVVQVQADP